MTTTDSLDIVFIGMTITSNWRNDHARIYRHLVDELDQRGHRVLFLERDCKRYAKRRDMPSSPYGNIRLYHDVEHLQGTYGGQIRQADLVIVGACLEDGMEIADWVNHTAAGATAFYDLDPKETFRQLRARKPTYLRPEQVSNFSLFLSTVGGPVLQILEERYNAPMARSLYCAADVQSYFPEQQSKNWDLGYLGDYSKDELPMLEELLVEPARHWHHGEFSVVGLQYPQDMEWPPHVDLTKRTADEDRRAYYNSQTFSLNITDDCLRRCGWAPSPRLFDAAACGVPVVTDCWKGVEEVLEPGSEILVSRNHQDTLHYVRLMSPNEREAIGIRAINRIHQEHLPKHRAFQLEGYARQLLERLALERSESRVTIPLLATAS